MSPQSAFEEIPEEVKTQLRAQIKKTASGHYGQLLTKKHKKIKHEDDPKVD